MLVSLVMFICPMFALTWFGPVRPINILYPLNLGPLVALVAGDEARSRLEASSVFAPPGGLTEDDDGYSFAVLVYLLADILDFCGMRYIFQRRKYARCDDGTSSPSASGLRASTANSPSSARRTREAGNSGLGFRECGVHHELWALITSEGGFRALRTCCIMVFCVLGGVCLCRPYEFGALQRHLSRRRAEIWGPGEVLLEPKLLDIETISERVLRICLPWNPQNLGFRGYASKLDHA